ncbi:MAG: SDR family oxidoreductase [Deinococcus-Thermus bacterium]|jgi:NAD(P)-dependent dehydrogenase (short-subunit alcohol dehydrogenase family)|nr:SDR family oxidoreductase [Deinococcota bacterium]
MTEKRALVTGGGRRLGRAMALYLGERGHDVAVHYNASADAAEEVAADIRRLGRQAVALRADLLDEAQVAGLVPRAAEALGGPLNVLVNNASVFEHDTLQTHTRESWDRHMESNLRAPVVLTQAFAAQAPRAPRDHEGDPLPQALVVNMLDTRVEDLTPNYMSYTLAKMGLYAFTTTAAQALAPEVCVNAIGPGWTLPDGGQTEEAFLRARAAMTPGRGPRPEDICAALGFFLESPAATGQTIIVDGGQQLDWRSRSTPAKPAAGAT